jgi:23S rRNA (guanosine2251-2'-O)-methyltransferase
LEHIEGRHPVLEAVRAGRQVHKILMTAGARGSAEAILKAARERGIPVSFLPREELDAMTRGRVHQGVVALAEPRAYHTADDLLAVAASRGEVPLLVILDGVEDPRNLGSVIRTAAAAGAHGVVIPTRRSAELTPAAVKAAAGAAEHLPVAKEVNLARTMDGLKEKGLWMIGADATARQVHTEVDLTMPAAVVVGGEHRGLRRLVREKCDFLVRIPMAGNHNSLNASVAAAIILYEAVRQRSLKGPGQGPSRGPGQGPSRGPSRGLSPSRKG